MEAVKKLIRKFKFSSDLFEASILSRKYLSDKGWFHSRYQRRAIDADQKPIPWFTYAAIHFLNQKLEGKSLRIFEFGSGNSTIWFASKNQSIVSVEYDAEFYEIIKPQLKAFNKVEYLQASLGVDYNQSILKYKKEFDIIVIDGRERVECARNSIQALKDDGVIIWDNSDREEYKAGYDLIEKAGFKRLDFRSLGPIGHVEWQTTIYYKSENCLDI